MTSGPASPSDATVPDAAMPDPMVQDPKLPNDGAADGSRPVDPLGEAMAAALADMLGAATIELIHTPVDGEPPPDPTERGTVAATGAGPPGWRLTVVLRLRKRVARVVQTSGLRSHLAELLHVLPSAGLAAIAPLRGAGLASLTGSDPLGPAMRRAVRDLVAAEVLAAYLDARVDGRGSTRLVADTIDYLIELSGSRVESHDLTHGVLVADVLADEPRLRFAYPADVRPAKRAPLLFDGERSVLLVDPQGRARTELQRRHFDKLAPGAAPVGARDEAFGRSLVGEATRVFGGVGFLLRADRSIWTFVDGVPLLVRRAEHWTAFPLELSATIADMIGNAAVATLVTQAAFTISAQPRGAILAIAGDADRVAHVVPVKDRYDLRNDHDRSAMRPETRLHHLIEADDLDEHTLVRLATLDGATIIDREGRLVAYGAIVTSSDSPGEGARTAAARTLSEAADVVLKVSVDGDINVFRDGALVTTLFGRPGA